MNLRTTIGSKLLWSLILCLWIFSAAQHAQAGPILVGSGYGETPEALHILLLFGPVAGPAEIHTPVPSPPGAISWNFSIVIGETDGAPRDGLPAIADFVQVTFGAQHKVGVHAGEGPAPNHPLLFNIKTTDLPLVPGNNVRTLPIMVFDHPPIADHNDLFRGTVTFTVGLDGLSITAFQVELFAFHCSPQCPAEPAINKQLQDVPELNALMLLGSGLMGLLGYNWRRKNVWLK